MIEISRSLVLQKLKEETIKDYRGFNGLVKDVMERKGDVAMAYLVKKECIIFPIEILKKEINEMVEDSLITITQWENFIQLLDNNHKTNGQFRVTNFLRRKRRIVVV